MVMVKLSPVFESTTAIMASIVFLCNLLHCLTYLLVILN